MRLLSSICATEFFKHYTTHDINVNCEVLGFHEAGLDSQYLGLPNCMSRNKTAVLGYLKDRVRDRIQSWDGSLLNKCGKEILLKTVTQSIPNYAMSVFLLPLEMCEDMEKMMCKYWWKSGKKEKNIHWMSWKRMCASKFHGGLGFRHLHEFNVALLGKQGWRLVTNPNGLVARIFKAKYFPNDSFLSAKLGASPSFVWRSVLAAQHILRQGLGRRVGAGNSVQILNGPWLPSIDNPYVSTESTDIEGHTVSMLMAPNDRKWDEDLVKHLFIQRDVNLILATPLSDSIEDSWYWRKEKSGNFSVKTAYTLIQESKPMVNQCGTPRFWKRMWSLAIPPKIKNFMWRAVTGCLPTKEMLRIKQVNINVACALCNREAESTSHVLLDCSFARCCWEIVEVSTDDTSHTSFTEWALNVFDKWDATKRQIGAMLCWTIWNCRNNLIWNQKSTEVQEAVYSARVVLSQWKETQDRFFDKSWGLLNPDDGDELWSPPNENKTKINTDAAVFEVSNRYSFAFAARNHKGELIEARSSCKEGCINPECAEAMGIREALSWIKEEQMKDVVVETDCLVAVQAIRDREAMSSYFGSLIQDCRNLLKEVKNKGVYLKFVKRSANNLAHAFASCSYSVADRIWRTNEVSPDIIHVLEQDLK